MEQWLEDKLGEASGKFYAADGITWHEYSKPTPFNVWANTRLLSTIDRLNTSINGCANEYLHRN